MSETTLVDPMDASKENSTIAGPVDEEATVMLNTAKDACMWNGEKFAEGALVNDGASIYECSYGTWVKKD